MKGRGSRALQGHPALPGLAEAARRHRCVIVTVCPAVLRDRERSEVIAREIAAAVGALPVVLVAFAEEGTVLVRGERGVAEAVGTALRPGAGVCFCGEGESGRKQAAIR